VHEEELARHLRSVVTVTDDLSVSHSNARTRRAFCLSAVDRLLRATAPLDNTKEYEASQPAASLPLGLVVGARTVGITLLSVVCGVAGGFCFCLALTRPGLSVCFLRCRGPPWTPMDPHGPQIGTLLGLGPFQCAPAHPFPCLVVFRRVSPYFLPHRHGPSSLFVSHTHPPGRPDICRNWRRWRKRQQACLAPRRVIPTYPWRGGSRGVRVYMRCPSHSTNPASGRSQVRRTWAAAGHRDVTGRDFRYMCVRIVLFTVEF